MSLSSASSCCTWPGRLPEVGLVALQYHLPTFQKVPLLRGGRCLHWGVAGACTEGWQVPALDGTEVLETRQLPASSPGLSSPAPGSVPSGGQGWGGGGQGQW